MYLLKIYQRLNLCSILKLSYFNDQLILRCQSPTYSQSITYSSSILKMFPHISPHLVPE